MGGKTHQSQMPNSTQPLLMCKHHKNQIILWKRDNNPASWVLVNATTVNKDCWTLAQSRGHRASMLYLQQVQKQWESSYGVCDLLVGQKQTCWLPFPQASFCVSHPLLSFTSSPALPPLGSSNSLCVVCTFLYAFVCLSMFTSQQLDLICSL